jgi:hypothetical protein
MSEVGEGVDIPSDSQRQLYDKKLSPGKYGLAVKHTKELLDGDKFGVFTKSGQSLATACQLTKEILAADIADNADTGSAAIYKSADGVNIFSASHPIDGGASTDSNLLTSSDLSITTIQNAMNALEETVDDRGLPLLIQGDVIVVPLAKRFLAAQLIKSTDDPTTADRAVTSLVDVSLTYKTWKYLTSTTSWYLMSTVTAGEAPGWIWLTRQPFELDHDVNVLNQTAWTVASERFARGVIQWRGWVKCTV